MSFPCPTGGNSLQFFRRLDANTPQGSDARLHLGSGDFFRCRLGRLDCNIGYIVLVHSYVHNQYDIVFINMSIINMILIDIVLMILSIHEQTVDVTMKPI
jgi:hypothetical protein